MIEIISISILSLLVVIFGYTTFNLLRKNEKMEDLNKYYADLFIQLQRVIKASDEKLTEIDTRGAFSSDDEIGWFFKQVKHIQEVMNVFKDNL